MDLPAPTRVLEALAKVHRGLLSELEGLAEKRTGLEKQLEAVDTEVKFKRRQLELVEATQEQLAAQGPGQRAIEGDGPGASSQVRASANLEDISNSIAHSNPVSTV
jgi:hypothetical protein